MKTTRIITILLVLTLMISGPLFSEGKQEEVTQTKGDSFSGELIVYHAGSLTVPFENIEKAFEAKYPNVDVVRTPGGSRAIARKITEFEDAVDVIASADYNVIDSMLIPDYANWNALFAENSMVIMYSKSSKFADEITTDNWYEILTRDGVEFGHSEPNADPCGYRSVLVFQMAENYYKIDGLNKKFLAARREKNIRPKSVELISMLETGALDYAFEYESVAMQHKAMNDDLEYIKLPVEINLSSIDQKENYAKASIELSGAKPGDTITRIGEPIVYSLTIPKTSRNKKLAEVFVKFLFNNDEGMKILSNSGQPVLDKVKVFGGENLPKSLNYLNK